MPISQNRPARSKNRPSGDSMSRPAPKDLDFDVLGDCEDVVKWAAEMEKDRLLKKLMMANIMRNLEVPVAYVIDEMRKVFQDRMEDEGFADFWAEMQGV